MNCDDYPVAEQIRPRAVKQNVGSADRSKSKGGRPPKRVGVSVKRRRAATLPTFFSAVRLTPLKRAVRLHVGHARHVSRAVAISYAGVFCKMMDSECHAGLPCQR
jgi:hypothetical protein